MLDGLSTSDVDAKKYLNQYHKCLYALLKVLTRRMALYHEDSAEEMDHAQTEKQFSVVLARILSKMKQVEEKCVQDFGDEQTRKILMPLTESMKPILRVLGMKLIKQGCGLVLNENVSSNASDKDAGASNKGLSSFFILEELPEKKFATIPEETSPKPTSPASTGPGLAPSGQTG